jgi:hypothetical protein
MIVDIKEIFAECQFSIASPNAAVCAVYMLTLYIVHSNLDMLPVQDSQNSWKFGNLKHAAYGGATHEI